VDGSQEAGEGVTVATETKQAAQSGSAPEAGVKAEVAHESDIPQWSGVHHLAMVTPDMDTTVRFYDGVLGMRLCATLMAGPMRHYFFEIDEGNTIAFFEIKGMETFAKPAGARPDRVLQFDHLSFALPDEAALLALRERLEAADCEVTTVVDHDIIRSIYFTDPNGIALEASWWVDDATARRSNYNDPVLFTDPNPVPAVKELRKGRLRSTPATKLA
jgi:catechol 2,3-dioxygenase-like lactoylglutathione lyase family enzyme